MKAMFCGRMPRLHFVGIGGIGMSGIAEVLLRYGYQVTGSDVAQNDVVLHLKSLGAKVYHGHQSDYVGDAEVVVVSTAIHQDNPELQEARARHLPIVHRGEMLAEMMRLGNGIAVAGSHGKTTTTSLIAHLLSISGFDPTAIVGGVVKNFGSNAKKGMGDYLVAEADESDGSFLELLPTLAVVTNIDPEHLEHYAGGFPDLLKAFVNFINSIPFYGLAILCQDHPTVRALFSSIKKRYVTYGLGESNYTLKNLEITMSGVFFNPIRFSETLPRVHFPMIGAHHAQNALAALAVADELGISFSCYQEALSSFAGVSRRFELKGQAQDILVYEDYGHHPVEIAATLKGAKQAFSRRLVVVFQPHRYSRTQLLLKEFGACFESADLVVLTDIYPAGEKPISGLSGESIAKACQAQGFHQVLYCPHKHDLPAFVADHLHPQDLVLLMGAGDIHKTASVLLKLLKGHSS